MIPVGERGGVDYLKSLLRRRFDGSTETFTWKNKQSLEVVDIEDEVFRYACFLSQEKLNAGEPVLAARVALTVAHRYPPARYPLARACLTLQLQAISKWETKYGKGALGVQLIEWAVRVQRALNMDTRELEALQLLYMPSDRQGYIMAARDDFLAIGQNDRAEQASALLLTFSSDKPERKHSPIKPVCALTKHEWLTTPLI